MLERIMQKFLQEELPRCAEVYGTSHVAPEIYSGSPESPIWFVGENPRGTGNPPSIAEALEAPDDYAAYYRGKYRSGRSLSKTGALYLRLWGEFATAAGVSQAQSWQWMMKTNKYAMPTTDQQTRFGLPEPIPLDEWFRELVQVYRPVVVIAFYRAGSDLIRSSGVGPVLDGKTKPVPSMAPGVSYLIDFGHIAGGRDAHQFPAGYMTKLGRHLRESLPERYHLFGETTRPTPPLAPKAASQTATGLPDRWLATAPWLPLAFAAGDSRVTPHESKAGNRLTLKTCQPRWLSVIRDAQAVHLTVGFNDGMALLERHAVEGRFWRQNESSDVVSVELAVLNEIHRTAADRLDSFLADSFSSHMTTCPDDH